SLARQVERGALTAEQGAAAGARIAAAASLTEVGSADLVIEAAVEDEAVKKAVFAELTPHLSAEALLASNTSSISITRLASATDRPERFIGLHFMKPAPRMETVRMELMTSGSTRTAPPVARTLEGGAMGARARSPQKPPSRSFSAMQDIGRM
ncbi:MAG: hypothetical protein KJ954_10445, partial [Alphaproteobacteria bacterium]|nr:hypothetical protein [Alphaproteobacteria bacterium]